MEFNKPTHGSNGTRRVNSANNLKPATAWAGNSRPEPVEPPAAHVRAKPVAKQHKSRWVLKTLLALVLISGLSAGAWFGRQTVAYAGIDTSRYQAVYLDNDNVYFGKVQVLLGGDLLLKDVFRVQAAPDNNAAGAGSTDTNDTGAAQPSSEIRLIKPGKELHAPDDTMLINRSRVRFIENIGNDSSVTKAIKDYRDDSDDK